MERMLIRVSHYQKCKCRILTIIKKNVKKCVFKTSQVSLEFIDLPLMLFSLKIFSSNNITTVVVGWSFQLGGIDFLWVDDAI